MSGTQKKPVRYRGNEGEEGHRCILMERKISSGSLQWEMISTHLDFDDNFHNDKLWNDYNNPEGGIVVWNEEEDAFDLVSGYRTLPDSGNLQICFRAAKTCKDHGWKQVNVPLLNTQGRTRYQAYANSMFKALTKQ